ncbi:MAG: hypothetical protein KGI33_03175 [Thaumarchaeota archaeon]|nr:hypothetical protein [Nitrososphaerota archaeon]
MNANFMLNLRKKLYGSDGVSRPWKQHPFPFKAGTRISVQKGCTIEGILPHLLVSSSFASIGSKEKMWVATSMLVRFLGTTTNNLVVIENDEPSGLLGGSEALENFSKNPSYSFFLDTTVEDVMSKSLYLASSQTRIADLVEKMRKIRRDFALVQNSEGAYSTVSARRLLEAGILSESHLKVADIPRKEICAFKRDDTIGMVISTMIRNETEILTLENTPQYVNPQTIFEKIVELNYLEKIDNFLDLKGTALNLKYGRIISENTSLPETCRIMLSMKNSFVMTSNNVVTPWDIVQALRWE